MGRAVSFLIIELEKVIIGEDALYRLVGDGNFFEFFAGRLECCVKALLVLLVLLVLVSFVSSRGFYSVIYPKYPPEPLVFSFICSEPSRL